MKEDLEFENLALRDALENANAKIALDAQRLQNAREKIQSRTNLAVQLTSVLGSIAALATGIAFSIHNEASEIKPVLHKFISSEDPPPSGEDEILLRGGEDEKIEILTEAFGEPYIKVVLNKAQNHESVEKHVDLSNDLTVTGSHNFMNAEEAAAYIKGFPSSWTHNKVARITIKQENFGPVSSYSTSGRVIGRFSSNDNSITLYGSIIKEKNLRQFDLTVAHEIAHGNDWLRDSELTPTERINLLAKVYVRVNSEDRFRSGYVESIGTNDKKTTLSHKCEEYFAEIAAAYFNDPSTLNYKDFTIIHNLISKKSPDFDIDKSKWQRVSSFSTHREI